MSCGALAIQALRRVCWEGESASRNVVSEAVPHLEEAFPEKVMVVRKRAKRTPMTMKLVFVSIANERFDVL